MNKHDPSQVARRECDISVDHLYQQALRAVERWVLNATPCQPKERKKHRGAIRNMITASSSHVLSFIPRGSTQWVYSVGLIFVSATEKVHDRARAPSRQTRRAAANEVQSRVAPRKGADLFLFSQTGISKRNVITYSWPHTLVNHTRTPSGTVQSLESAPHVLPMFSKGWTRKVFGQRIGHILRS